MSPARKLEIAGQFQLAARELKKAALKQLHPDWTDEKLKLEVRKIFLHAAS
jgi:hypothetical protein